MQGSEYPVTDNHAGVFYHMVITCYILTRLLRCNFKFELSIENSIAHPFDDIVVKYSKHSSMFTRLIQCKNKENGEFYESDLKDAKRGYGLLKYLRGFVTNVRNNFPEDCELIICTNAKCKSYGVFDLDAVDERDFIAGDNFSILVYSFTQDFKKSYRNECPYELTSSCEDFFSELRFWTTKNTKEMKDMILNELKEFYDRDVAEISYFLLNEAYGKMLEDVKVSTNKRNTNRMTRAITHEYLTELNKKVMKIFNRSIWYETPDPTLDFYGMEEFLEQLKSNRGSAAIIGNEGVGKTQLALKFARDEMPEHCIFIDSKNEDTFRNSIHTLAFQILRIKCEDYEGKAKDIQSVLEEVSEYFLGSNTMFIFDDAKTDFKYASFFRDYQVIITTRERKLCFEPKIEVSGFNSTEAERFVIKHLPGEEVKNVSKLVIFCDKNPKRIREALDIIKGITRLREISGLTFSLGEFLEMYASQEQ